MEILALASQHQHRHWHGHCKKIVFAFRIFFKIEYFCYFLCLVMVSVPLCYKYLFLHDLLFIKSKASIGVLENSYLNIRKHPSWCFKKTTAPKISAYFAYFPAKHPGWSSFQVHSQAFLGLLQKALQSIYSEERDLSEQFENVRGIQIFHICLTIFKYMT